MRGIIIFGIYINSMGILSGIFAKKTAKVSPGNTNRPSSLSRIQKLRKFLRSKERAATNNKLQKTIALINLKQTELARALNKIPKLNKSSINYYVNLIPLERQKYGLPISINQEKRYKKDLENKLARLKSLNNRNNNTLRRLT